MKFGGGSKKCGVSGKSVYPNDPQITIDGVTYLKCYAKCSFEGCGKQLTLSDFAKFDGKLFCKTHYFQRFAETNSYGDNDKFAKAGSTQNKTAEATAPAPAPAPVPGDAEVTETTANED